MMLYLEIITPDKILFANEITIVKLPGITGSFEILENHAPLISALGQGKIKVKEATGMVSYFNINDGLVEVSNNKISVLVAS